MLSIIANQLPAFLLLFIILSQSLMLQVMCMRLCDMQILYCFLMTTSSIRTEAIAGMGFLD